MSKRSQFRGHAIELDEPGGRWVYCDTGEPTVDTWRERGCGHCGQHNTPEGHDACLGELPGVLNACCGHGEQSVAYVQFEGGGELRGRKALDYFAEQGGER